MVINNNLQAQNSQRIFNQVQGDLAKSMEKLSSGLRINSSADDAAGLSISEKMRNLIKGTQKASRNLEDGISMAQVAEGGLAEIHDILARMRELTVQSHNDTYTEDDRAKMDREMEELSKEINNIGKNTEFNEIPVLDLGKDYLEIKGVTTINVTEQTTVTTVTKSSIGQMPDWTKEDLVEDELVDGNLLTPAPDSTSHSEAEIDFTNLNDEMKKEDLKALMNSLVGSGFYSTCCTCNRRDSVVFIDSSDPTTHPGPPQGDDIYLHTVDLKDLLKEIDDTTPNAAGKIQISDLADKLVDTIIDQTKNNLDHYTNFKTNVPSDGKLVIYDNRPGQIPSEEGGNGIVAEGYDYSTSTDVDDSAAPTVFPTEEKVINTTKKQSYYGLPASDLKKFSDSLTTSVVSSSSDRTLTGTSETIVTTTVTRTVDIKHEYEKNSIGDFSIGIQHGANMGEKYNVIFPLINTEELNIHDLDYTTDEGRDEAFDKLDFAVDRISHERMRMGVAVNRMESMATNNHTYALNMTESESQIRDADMAKEMIGLTKNNILSQSSQSMLAQAKNQPEAVLSLLS